MDRASSWTQSQLLLPKEKNHISVLPFVTPYDPNLYQLTHIYIYIYLDSIGLTSIMINCYPNCSPSPPMVAYQCHRNLKEEFVHSKFWKLYHRHIYHLLGKHLHLSGSIHGIVWGRYQEGFHLLYYTCIYIYIYIYIFQYLDKEDQHYMYIHYGIFEPLSIKFSYIFMLYLDLFHHSLTSYSV